VSARVVLIDVHLRAVRNHRDWFAATASGDHPAITREFFEGSRCATQEFSRLQLNQKLG